MQDKMRMRELRIEAALLTIEREIQAMQRERREERERLQKRELTSGPQILPGDD